VARRLRHLVSAAWPALTELGLAEGASLANLVVENDLATACAQAEFVQESAPEDLDLKRTLLADIDAVTPADVVISSSTSGYGMSEMATKADHADRLVVGHPFNPPYLIPLVEVVGGPKTSPEAIGKAMQFYRDIGKHPIHIKKEVKGHVANRLQVALWREAVHLVAEGIVSVADADAAIAYGPGLRWALMGPHLTFHMAGGEGGMKHFMDHLGGPIQGWMDDLGQTRLTPDVQKKIIDGVAEEAAGRNMADLQRWRDRKLIDILKVSGEQ